MMNKLLKRAGLAALLAAFAAAPLDAIPIASSTWGFSLDPPEGYTLSGGDNRNEFSFVSPFGTTLYLAVYPKASSPEVLAGEFERKLGASAERHAFKYHGRRALVSALSFPGDRANERFSGWAFYVELNGAEASRPASPQPPILVAVAYGPPGDQFQALHLSALDSIAPAAEDRLRPGPITEFSCPAGERKQYPLASPAGADGTSVPDAWFREDDAEAAQSLVDREFAVFKRYADSKNWREAWKRFYRAVYRDSFDRLKDAAFVLERLWNTSGNGTVNRNQEARTLAEQTLRWVQSFKYERDFLGSDFVNLVSAAQEGRGDCDSRAMLFAIILEQAGVPAAMMVSREFGHAMGLADIEGEGARFPFRESGKSYNWMVAETTAPVGIGRIERNQSEITKWLAIVF
jgi:hypothetical protein